MITHVVHHVIFDGSFDQLMATFKAHEGARRKAGFHGQHTVLRSVDNPNEAWIILPYTGNKEQLDAFLADEATLNEFVKAGVNPGKSPFHFLELVEEKSEAEDLVAGEGI